MTAIPCVVVGHIGSRVSHGGIVTPHLGVAEYAFASKGVDRCICSNKNALFDIGNNGHFPELFHGFKLCHSVGSYASLGTIFVSISSLQRPYANRHSHKNGLTGQQNVTIFFNNNNCCIIISKSIRCHKALSNDHVIKLPNAIVIKVDNNLHFLNLFNGSRHKIHIVYRTKLYAICGGVCCNKLHCAIRLRRVDGNLPEGRTIVAYFVASGEFHNVLTIGKNHILKRNFSVSIRSCHFHAINVCLNRRSVNSSIITFASIISNRNPERDLIGSYNLSVQNRSICHAINSISKVREDRSFTIINSSRVVNRKIIKIELISSRDVTLLKRLVIVRCTVTVGNVELHHCAISCPTYRRICRGVRIQVVPSGLIK